MAENPEVVDGLRIARTRTRASVKNIDVDEVRKRIRNFYDKDNEERSDEVEARL